MPNSQAKDKLFVRSSSSPTGTTGSLSVPTPIQRKISKGDLRKLKEDHETSRRHRHRSPKRKERRSRSRSKNEMKSDGKRSDRSSKRSGSKRSESKNRSSDSKRSHKRSSSKSERKRSESKNRSSDSKRSHKRSSSRSERKRSESRNRSERPGKRSSSRKRSESKNRSESKRSQSRRSETPNEKQKFLKRKDDPAARQPQYKARDPSEPKKRSDSRKRSGSRHSSHRSSSARRDKVRDTSQTREKKEGHRKAASFDSAADRLRKLFVLRKVEKERKEQERSHSRRKSEARRKRSLDSIREKPKTPIEKKSEPTKEPGSTKEPKSSKASKDSRRPSSSKSRGSSKKKPRRSRAQSMPTSPKNATITWDPRVAYRNLDRKDSKLDYGDHDETDGRWWRDLNLEDIRNFFPKKKKQTQTVKLRESSIDVAPSPRRRAMSVPVSPRVAETENNDVRNYADFNKFRRDKQIQKDAFQAKGDFEKFRMYLKLMKNRPKTPTISRRPSVASEEKEEKSQPIQLTTIGESFIAEPVQKKEMDQELLKQMYDYIKDLKGEFQTQLDNLHDEIRDSTRGYHSRLTELKSMTAMNQAAILSRTGRSPSRSGRRPNLSRRFAREEDSDSLSAKGFITLNYPPGQSDEKGKSEESRRSARHKRTKREFRQFLRDKTRRSKSLPARKPADKAEFDRFKTYLKLVGRQRPKPDRTLEAQDPELIILEPTAEFLFQQCRRGVLKPEQITPETIEALDQVTKQNLDQEGKIICVIKEASQSFARQDSEESLDVSKAAPSSSPEPDREIATLNLPSEQDFKDFQRYKALLAQRRSKSLKSGKKLPSKMDFERFLAFKRRNGKSAEEPLSDTDIEQACESVQSPGRIFSARSYQQKNILHDGLWSDLSDEERGSNPAPSATRSANESPTSASNSARPRSSRASIKTISSGSDHEDEKIGSFGVWCFLGGVAAVSLLNYLLRDDEPRYVYYIPQPPPKK